MVENQRLEVIIYNKEVERFPSRVEGIMPTKLHIAMPMRKSVPVLLQPGTKFTARFIANDACWQFSSSFIDKMIVPLPIWIVTAPTEFEKIQLRSYVRIAVSMPATITIIEDKGESLPFNIKTKDLSGGGVQLVSEKKVPVGTTINLVLNLPEMDLVKIKGEVVRADKPNGVDIYWLAVKFIEISEKDREKIIKYIFKLQIERRQKGLSI